MTEQQVVFDQQRQLDLIREGLQQGEQVIAVYDAIGAGTGFIGLTDRRAIIQDNSYFGKQVVLISIPCRFITSVGFVSDKSFLGKWASTSKIAIVTSAKTHEVEFRGTARQDTCTTSSFWKILQ